MNVNSLMTNIIIARYHEFFPGFLKCVNVFLKIIQETILKILSLFSRRSRREIRTHYRNIAVITANEPAFGIIRFHPGSIFNMIRFLFRKYSHPAVSLFFRRKPIMFVSQFLENRNIHYIRRGFYLLEAEHIRIRGFEPIRQALPHCGTQAVYIIRDDPHYLNKIGIFTLCNRPALRKSSLQRLLIFILFTFSLNLPGFSQVTVKDRDTFIPVLTDTIVVDSLSLVPGSVDLFELIDLRVKHIDTIYYRILYSESMILFDLGKMLKDSIRTDSIIISYRVFPISFSKTWSHKDPKKIADDQKLIVNPFVYTPGKEKATDIFNMGGLNKDGSISRGVSFGNNQDVVVNSSMNLNLSGKLSEDLELLMSATDDNIPIQADGTTAQLQEFDKIFIQVSDKRNKIIAGDFILQKPPGYFMHYNKKALGLSYSYFDKYKKEGLGNAPTTINAFTLSGAVSKGKFARNIFTGIEGNQGPYRLRGSENELFIIILSGTEMVYIDGELMKRGLENDYVIDYNTSEILFTPNQLITKDKRIIVEFQYSDKQYARSIFQSGYEYVYDSPHQSKKTRFYVNMFAEQDSKNKPLQQTLDDTSKIIMASVGDSLQDAFIYSADSTAFNNSEVLYDKKDTMVGLFNYPDIYIYSTDPNLAHFRISFSFVGQGNGNYVPVNTTANGKVYQWIIPDTINGILRGSYEPIVLLVTPKKKQMLSAGTSIEFNRFTKLSVEGAASIHDINQFSKLDKKNDIGYSGKMSFETPLLRYLTKSKDALPHDFGLKLGVGYEYVQEYFSAIERFRPVEFERDWNKASSIQSADQHIISASLFTFRDKKTPLLYKFSTFLEGSAYEGYRHEFSANLKAKGTTLNSHASWLTTQTNVFNTSFLRGNLTATQKLGKFLAGVKGQAEQNLFTYDSSDSLLGNSYAFYEWEAFAGGADTSKMRYKAWYKQRMDGAVKTGSMRGSTYADNVGASFSAGNGKKQKLAFTLTYRKLRILDTSSTIHKPDESLLGRIEYEFRAWNGAVISSTFYEVGSGLEPKKEFSFIEVPAGQGVYTWVDYNGNNVKELNEFELAAFPDQATYIKIYTPSQEYIRAYSNQFSQTFTLRPSAIWKKKKGFRKFLTNFSNQTTFRGERKSTETDLLDAYNPFLQDPEVATLQSLSSYFRNTLNVNQGSPHWALDLSWYDTRGKILLNNGFDTRTNIYYEGNLRWNITRKWALFSMYKDGYKTIHSEFFTSKDYNYHYYEAKPKISYQPNNVFRIQGSYSFSEKINSADLGGQRALVHNYGTEIKYNTLTKGTLQCKANYIYIDYAGAVNSSVAFEMLEGLVPGENITWNLSFQRTLSNNLQITINYDGRKPASGKIIHTGGAQVRAFF